MTDIRAIGIDPGPTPGIVRIDYIDQRPVRMDVFQCTHTAATLVLAALLREPWTGETYVQTERFLVGRGSMRSAKAGAKTRDLVGQLQQTWAEALAVIPPTPAAWWFRLQNASQTKLWATDERLEALGLLKLTRGMPHARDAARHCIYTATHDGRIPDPLSRKARR